MFQFSNKQLRAALFCYTAFLVYATLWPFDFHFIQGFADPRKISWIPFFDPVEGPGRKDAVMNLLVFLPFGFFSFLSNFASGKIRRPALIATLLGGVLSFSVEVAQVGLPSRHPAVADLLMNTTGALLGALVARTLQRGVHTDSDAFRLWIRRNWLPLASIGYALGLLASSMQTFDPILNWRVLGIRAEAFIGSPLLPDHLDRDNTAWMVLSFGFLSFLVAEGFAGSSMIRRRLVGYVAAFIVCSLFVLSLEATQILFRSRHPLLSHALLGTVGVVYGILWHRAADRFRDPAGNGKSVFPIPILLFFIHYAALVSLAFLSPIPHSSHGFRFDPRGFIPLFFYLQHISLVSIYAALKASVLHVPIGIVGDWSRAGNFIRRWWIPVLFSVVLQGTIEICKGCFGYQYPDPTNLFLAALGAFTGSRLLRGVRTQISR